MDTKENSGLSAKLRAAYEKVAEWPEKRMPGVDITTLGEGFIDLLHLRNIIPDTADLIDTQASTIAELTRERDEAWGARNENAKLKGQRDAALALSQAAEAKLQATEKALEPFDDFAEFLEVETEGFSDTDRIELFLEESDVLLADVPVSAFRRARTALADIRGDEK